MDRSSTSSFLVIPTPRAGPAARYAVAVGSTLLALAVTLLVRPYVEQTIFIFFFASLAASAWYGGTGPGVLASILSILAVDWYILQPVGSLSLREPADVISFGTFLAVALLISQLTGSLRRSRMRAEERRAEAETLAQQLQEQATELEQQSEEAQALAEELEGTNAQLRESAETAARANRAKTEFLTFMSHELRTPLNAIAGYANLLEIGVHGPLTPAQAEHVRRIQLSERHLLALINDILNFARLESGSIRYELEDVPVRDVLIGVEALIAPQLQARALTFSLDCDEDLTAHADAEKTRQIILNLLSNAIKFTEPGGDLALTGEARGDRVLIHVRDTGQGIPADQLERIFEPFVQVDRTLTSNHEGAGLGLAISRDLARGMDGELTVVSTPGRGSTFTLSLPARAAPAGKHDGARPAHERA